MSILNCSTRLCIINHTGLPAIFSFTPETPMRLQPLGQAHATGNISSQATSITEWFQEFWQLMTYGPTYNKLQRTLAPNAEETIRLNVTSPMMFEIDWNDPSVSWEQHESGKWSFDISNCIDVTMHLRGDVGEYVQQRSFDGPNSVKSVYLKHYVEIACDDNIPFSIEKTSISKMFWRKDINLQGLVGSS